MRASPVRERSPCRNGPTHLNGESPHRPSRCGRRGGRHGRRDETLALTPAERGAVAHELRRYGNYRRGIGVDLWDSAIAPEPGEPDPPGITPKVEKMVDSHLAFAGRCDWLAAAFESDEPVVSLDRSAIDAIGMALEEGFIDEFPPEIARTAMLCRLVNRRGNNPSEQNLGATGEVMIIPAEPQPGP